MWTSSGREEAKVFEKHVVKVFQPFKTRMGPEDEPEIQRYLEIPLQQHQ